MSNYKFVFTVLTLFCVFCFAEARPGSLRRMVSLKNQKGYIRYETRVKNAVSTCSGEPKRISYLLKGNIPSGFVLYGSNRGFCFKYRCGDEVLIYPLITFFETPDSSRYISLHTLELGTEQCSNYYYYLSPRYTLLGRLYESLSSDYWWKVFPKNHIAYILKGDIAEIYVIGREKTILKMLSIIISGCETTEDFDTQWQSLNKQLSQ